MDAKDVISDIRSALSEVSREGKHAFPVAGMDALLDGIERRLDPPDVSLDAARAALFDHRLAIRRMHYENRIETNREMIRHTVSAGASALRAAFLVNGGAVIALLAFAGGERGAEDPDLTKRLSVPLGLYSLGVLLSAIATGATYLAQAGFGGEFRKNSRSVGSKARAWVIILVGSSYLTFVLGSFFATFAVTSPQKAAWPSPTTSPTHSLPSQPRKYSIPAPTAAPHPPIPSSPNNTFTGRPKS